MRPILFIRKWVMYYKAVRKCSIAKLGWAEGRKIHNNMGMIMLKAFILIT